MTNGTSCRKEGERTYRKGKKESGRIAREETLRLREKIDWGRKIKIGRRNLKHSAKKNKSTFIRRRGQRRDGTGQGKTR